MARKAEPAPRQAVLSAVQKRSAITKLRRRLDDLAAFDPSSIRDRDDVRVTQLELRLEQAIDSIFPVGTVENNRYRSSASTLDTAGFNFGYDTPLHKIISGMERGKSRCIATIEAIISEFEEDLASDNGENRESQVIAAYQGLELHPAIQEAASSLYLNGHYAQAVEDAVKALNNVVRLKSGLMEDGNRLMTEAFKRKDPVLAFNDLLDENDLSEQEGYMFMFKGAVSGLRNPRAHRLVSDDPERALEFIAYVSLLAKLAESAEKRAPGD